MEKVEKPTLIEPDRIEGPSNEAAPEAASFYLDYWSEFADNHPKLRLEYPALNEVTQSTEKRLRDLDEEVRNNYDQPGRCYATEVREWYTRLGSLNELRGAEESLLRAGIIMERRSEHEKSSDYDHLLTGCLFHEAALLINRPYNNPWIDIALEHYEPIINKYESRDILNANYQKALRYSYDVLFQKLFDSSHNLRNKGIHDFSELELQYTRLQYEYIEDFLKLSEQVISYCNSISNKEGDYAGILKGLVFEWYSLLAYRHAIWRKGKLGKTTIRNAFLREGESGWYKGKNKGALPKKNVDAIIAYHEKGQTTGKERLQLKTAKKEYKELKNYLPEPDIRIIQAYSQSTDKFAEQLKNAAELLQRQYSGEYLSSREHDEIQRASSFIKTDLLEKAA